MRYILFFLLFTAAGGAQVTENDLLGEWNLSRAEGNGWTVDMETGSIIFPEKDLERMQREGLKPEKEGKKILDMLKGLTVYFEPGILTFTGMGDKKVSSYRLVYKEGNTYLINETKKNEVLITFTGDSYLRLASGKGDFPGVLEFKKKQ